MARNRYLDDEEQKTKISAGLLKRLLRYTFPYKKLFFWGTFLVIINVVISLIWPKFTQWIIDDVLTAGGRFYGSYTALWISVPIIFALILADNVIAARRVLIVTKLGHNTIFDIRKELFDHVQTLSFKYFDDRPAGKILVRITSYVDGFQNLLSNSIIQLIVDIFTLVAITIIMFTIDWRLTLISFTILFPLVIFTTLIRKRIAKWARLVANRSSNRTAYIHENIMGSVITQAFNRQEYNSKELERIDNDVNSQYMHQHIVQSTMGPVVDMLSTIATILVYFFAIKFTHGDFVNGGLTLGQLTAFTAYMVRFWSPITSFTNVLSQFSEATSHIERIFETIDEKPDITDKPDAYDMPDITGSVEYKNVTFAYDKENTVLDNVSFTVKPGQMIAFVGPTGAGKTTVVNLLSRFYDVTDGAVLIDGHDVRDVTLKSLRTQVGVMMQDSFVFSGTIIDNIRYGRPTATDEECIDAARKIYASTFIEALPQGYYTKVQERGAGLSTGERQLLSFARAILADPKILILDEATSSIDTQTELLIQKALHKLLENRTSFVIAHRLSTIKRADKIMCIANHGIAESGTHDELMAQKGIYYELNMSQYNALVNG